MFIGRRTAHAQPGFTLMELIVVLALLTMTAALAAPQLAGFVRGRASNEECRRLLSATEFARSEAVARGERKILWISQDGTEYGVRGGHAGSAGQTWHTARDTVISPIDEEGEPLSASADLIVWPDGEIDPASPAGYRILERGTAVWALVLNGEGVRYEVKTE